MIIHPSEKKSQNLPKAQSICGFGADTVWSNGGAPLFQCQVQSVHRALIS